MNFSTWCLWCRIISYAVIPHLLISRYVTRCLMKKFSTVSTALPNCLTKITSAIISSLILKIKTETNVLWLTVHLQKYGKWWPRNSMFKEALFINYFFRIKTSFKNIWQQFSIMFQPILSYSIYEFIQFQETGTLFNSLSKEEHWQ